MGLAALVNNELYRDLFTRPRALPVAPALHWGISVNAKAQQKMIVIRAILTVICFAGCFVVPLLFLLGAFFASTIYNIVDPKPAPPVDAW